MEVADRPLGKPRPKLFRALGDNEPPQQIQVDGQIYRLIELYKHDSWAVTANYANDLGKIVCKFNRQQSIFVVPMKWLGRYLAGKERRFYELLSELPCVPDACGPVVVNGKVLPYAVAHHWVAGAPLKEEDCMPETFFDGLDAGLAQIHSRGVAYVDLHKRENLIVGSDGRGYFIDFQVSMYVPAGSWNLLGRLLVKLFQEGDRYHLAKHRLRNSQAIPVDREARINAQRPWWLHAHRIVAQPLRQLRRRFLVWLGIRTGNGRVQSEYFTEDGLRASNFN